MFVFQFILSFSLQNQNTINISRKQVKIKKRVPLQNIHLARQSGTYPLLLTVQDLRSLHLTKIPSAFTQFKQCDSPIFKCPTIEELRFQSPLKKHFLATPTNQSKCDH